MKVSIFGSGYVGLVTGACLAKLGHEVFCIDKNKSEFSVLAKYTGKIKKIILYGDSRNDIKQSIKKYFNVLVYKNFHNAVIESIKLSKRNDNVLLSPACASYDQFKSYRHRGQKFKEIINEYYDE